jgi:hypothetical protein
MNLIFIWNIGITFLLFVPYVVVGQKLEFQEEKEGILLLENGAPRYFYRTSAPNNNSRFARTNYIHPLYGLDGEVLTEDFPEDHPHHHGIFLAWHQLYAEGKRIANPWMNEGIGWKVLNTETTVKGKRAVLSAEIEWIQKATAKAVVREDLIISFERVMKDVFALSFDIKLTALVDGVAIGGSEDEKGYGGFSVRIKLPEDANFRSRIGKVAPAKLPLQVGPWVDISGHFSSSLNGPSGIIIMGEPGKLPSYKGWILRDDNSMQNMAFPGPTPLAINKDGSLSLRNQLLIHRDLNTEEIAGMYKEFRESGFHKD